MGVRDAIVDKLPASWDVALRQHRLLTRFTNYVYLKFVPKEWRNKQKAKTMHRQSVARIVHLFENRNFLGLFDPNDPSFHTWNEVYDTIIKLEEQWKQIVNLKLKSSNG